jgi:hypothetical protein
MGTNRKPMGTKKTQLGTELQKNSFHTQKHEIDLSSITFLLFFKCLVPQKGQRIWIFALVFWVKRSTQTPRRSTQKSKCVDLF